MRNENDRIRGAIPWNVAALERSDNVADRSHAFAVLKRGYPRRAVIVQEREMRPARRAVRMGYCHALRRHHAWRRFAQAPRRRARGASGKRSAKTDRQRWFLVVGQGRGA